MTGFQKDTALDRLPRSAGGFVEAVKRGVITALRTTLTGASFGEDSESEVYVDMEYPAKVENYPGIFVQFSTSVLQPSGMAHETITEDGKHIKQWYYEGRVSLLVLALSSLERDRIADVIISEFAFQDTDRNPETGESKSSLFSTLEASPYVTIGINSDALRPSGQSITVGTPWNPEQLVYEDNYGFDIIGEFQQTRDSTGLVTLGRIDVYPTDVSPRQTIVPGEWF